MLKTPNFPSAISQITRTEEIFSRSQHGTNVRLVQIIGKGQRVESVFALNVIRGINLCGCGCNWVIEARRMRTVIIVIGCEMNVRGIINSMGGKAVVFSPRETVRDFAGALQLRFKDLIFSMSTDSSWHTAGPVANRTERHNAVATALYPCRIAVLSCIGRGCEESKLLHCWVLLEMQRACVSLGTCALKMQSRCQK